MQYLVLVLVLEYKFEVLVLVLVVEAWVFVDIFHVYILQNYMYRPYYIK